MIHGREGGKKTCAGWSFVRIHKGGVSPPHRKEGGKRKDRVGREESLSEKVPDREGRFEVHSPKKQCRRPKSVIIARKKEKI